MLGLGLQPQLEQLRKLLLPLKRQAGQQLPGPIRNPKPPNPKPSARKRPQVLLLAGSLYIVKRYYVYIYTCIIVIYTIIDR